MEEVINHTEKSGKQKLEEESTFKSSEFQTMNDKVILVIALEEGRAFGFLKHGKRLERLLVYRKRAWYTQP